MTTQKRFGFLRMLMVPALLLLAVLTLTPAAHAAERVDGTCDCIGHFRRLQHGFRSIVEIDHANSSRD